jgi:hypothetical protein
VVALDDELEGTSLEDVPEVAGASVARVPTAGAAVAIPAAAGPVGFAGDPVDTVRNVGFPVDTMGTSVGADITGGTPPEGALDGISEGDIEGTSEEASEMALCASAVAFSHPHAMRICAVFN